MAESTVVKVRRDGTLTLSDGTGTPVTYTVAYENGDVSFDGGSKADRIVIRDRGTIVGLRKGDDPVPSLRFAVPMRSKLREPLTVMPMTTWPRQLSAFVPGASVRETRTPSR